MVIVRLSGGLGNQLFQYAAARSLSITYNLPIRLDKSYYRKSLHRNFELSWFKIPPIPEITKAEADQNFYEYNEPHFHFDSRFYALPPGNIYLTGFWQSEKYFLSHKDILQKELQIKESAVKHLQYKSLELKESESVAVHIRREDYIRMYRGTYGILEADYYTKAIEYIHSYAPSAKFFFFSDDMNWVKTNIRTNHPHEYVSGALTRNVIEDFYIMNSCRHSIIANSTLSWWAAWLREDATGIVVAPDKWMNNVVHNLDDVIPGKWIKL